jgi:type IV pilus assembly protein PilW
LSMLLKPSIRKFEVRKQDLLDLNQGISLVELLVGSIVALIVLGITFSGALFNRNLFLQDQTRNNVNQNLRSALDILGNDLLQVGEGVGNLQTFPALQVTNGGPGTSSEVIIRRQAVSRPLLVCADVTAGSSTPLQVAIPGSLIPGCAPGADLNANIWPDQDVELWANYRQSLPVGSQMVQAFIFDGANQGETFTYNNEARVPNDPTGTFEISRSLGNWLGNYVAGSASVYLVETRRYRLCPAAQITLPNCTAVAGADNILHVIVNDDFTNPVQLTNGIDQLNIQVSERATTTPPGPVTNWADFCWQGAIPTVPSNIPAAPNSCGGSTTWNRITSVAVTLRGLNTAPSDMLDVKQDQATRTFTKQFFPRNVLN